MHKVLQDGRDSVEDLDRVRRSGLHVDAVDEDGLTCLFVACVSGEPDVTEWLLANGADVTVVNPFDRRSPLHAASAGGHVAVVAQLLNAGASSTARDGAGQTPAEVASVAQHLDVVRVFLEHSRKELREVHLEKARRRQGKC